MAEIEARREARRRRILQNCENRLKKITGVEERKSGYELDGFKSCKVIEDCNNGVLEDFERQTAPVRTQQVAEKFQVHQHEDLIVFILAIIRIMTLHSYGLIFPDIFLLEVFFILMRPKEDRIFHHKYVKIWKFIRIHLKFFQHMLLYFFSFVILLFIQSLLFGL